MRGHENQSSSQDQNLFHIKYNNVELEVRCVVTSENGYAIICFFINDVNSALKTLDSTEIINISKAYKQYFTNQRDNLTKQNDLGHATKFKLFKEVFSSLFVISQSGHCFRLLQNFKKRMICTVFESKPIAMTVLDIDSDIITVISKKIGKTEQFLVDLHFSNTEFSESMISNKLTKFLHGVGKWGYFVSIVTSITIPTLDIAQQPQILFDYNHIPDLIYHSIILLGVPVISIKILRKMIPKLLFRRIIST